MNPSIKKNAISEGGLAFLVLFAIGALQYRSTKLPERCKPRSVWPRESMSKDRRISEEPSELKRVEHSGNDTRETFHL